MPLRGVSSLYLFEQFVFLKKLPILFLRCIPIYCNVNVHADLKQNHWPLLASFSTNDSRNRFSLTLSPYKNCGRKLQNQIKTKQHPTTPPTTPPVPLPPLLHVAWSRQFPWMGKFWKYLGNITYQAVPLVNLSSGATVTIATMKEKTLYEKMTHFPQGTVQAGKIPHDLSPKVL